MMKEKNGKDVMNKPNTCLVCQQEFTENNHFWRVHKIKEAEYYTTYIPRYSKQTGELIQFKNREFYMNSDFNDKREMMFWFKSNPEESIIYAKNWLQKRKDQKGLIYAMSQVELRSLTIPSIIWFKKTFGSYKDLCESLGFKVKFDREDDVISCGDLSPHSKIIIDSREQKALNFREIPSEVSKLDYGDYALSPNKYKVHIERKGLSDFVGTLGTGFERFEREIKRAKKEGAYLIVLVEAPMNDALYFNHLPYMRHIQKCTPDYVFHHVRELMQKYTNLQFLFCGNRREATTLIKTIFTLKRHPKHLDLQYYYDTKRFKI